MQNNSTLRKGLGILSLFIATTVVMYATNNMTLLGSKASTVDCSSVTNQSTIAPMTSCISSLISQYGSTSSTTKKVLLLQIKTIALKRNQLLVTEATTNPKNFLIDASLANLSVPTEMARLVERSVTAKATYHVTHGDNPKGKTPAHVIVAIIPNIPVQYIVHSTSSKILADEDTGYLQLKGAVSVNDQIVVTDKTGLFTSSPIKLPVPTRPKVNGITIQNAGPGLGARPINVIIMKARFSDAPDDVMPTSSNTQIRQNIITTNNNYLKETTFNTASLIDTFDGNVQVYPKDDSYYMIDTSNPDPTNPYSTPFNSKTSCPQYAIQNIIRKRAIADGGPSRYLDINDANYDSSAIRIFVFPDRGPNAPSDRRSCGWNGVEDFASGLVGPVIWMNGPISPYTAIHEVGHALGLAHAGSLPAGSCYPDCTLPTPGSSANLTYEYGDRMDAMGYINTFQFNAPNKYYLNLFTSSSQVQTITSPGYYKTQLYPIEHTGTQTHMIRISRSVTNPADYYYVELRRPIGYDANINPALQPYNGILIHKWDGNLNDYFAYKALTRLIDPTPDSVTDQATWFTNQPFTDTANNITIRLDSNANSTTTSLCDPVRVTVCVGQSSCPINNDVLATNVACSATGTPQPTPTPTQSASLPTSTPRPTPTNIPSTPVPTGFVTRVSSFHQSVGDVKTGAQKQTFISDDTGGGYGSTVYFRYLRTDKTWGPWQVQPISGAELQVPTSIATSIRSFSQSKRPSDGKVKEDVLSKDGDKIYSRFWNGSGWDAWALGANVTDLKLPDGSTTIRAFAQSISPVTGQNKQDFLVGKGDKIYSRFWNGSAWGGWDSVTYSNTIGNKENAIRSFSQGVDPNNIPKQDVLADSGENIYYRKFGTNGSTGWPGFTLLTVVSLGIPRQ